MKTAVLIILFSAFCTRSFGQCVTTYSTVTATECDTFISPSNQVLTSSGTYYDTLINSSGCDSIITLNLTIHQNVSSTIFAHTCGEPYYMIDSTGNTIFIGSTGLYVFHYQSVNGCDSTVYLDLEIDPCAMNIYNYTVCNEFISDGSISYTQTGSYIEAYTSVMGCDSVITYHITIDTVDASVSQGLNGASTTVLTANMPNASYQWVDCNAGYALIPDATDQSFTAELNGDYACIVTNNTCTDTSDCFHVGSVSVDEYQTVFKIYPNPGIGLFTLETGYFTNQSYVQIRNLSGKLVYAQQITDTKSVIDLTDLAPGLYTLHLTNADNQRELKIIIE